MVSFRLLHSHLKVISNKDLNGTRFETGFERAFATLLDQDVQTFTRTMLLNLDQLEKQLDKEEFQEIGSFDAFRYFIAHTRTEVQQFLVLLMQHMESVKKSIDERVHHKREYDSRVKERQMQSKEGKVDSSKALNVGVFIQKINTAYSDPLNTVYRSSDTESESEISYLISVLNFLSFFRANLADIFTCFPLSLADDARQWWIDEGEGKITTWEELVEKFFYKFYPESYDGEEEMLDEGNNWGINPLKFISRVNSSFKNHMKVDRRTKKVLFHAWMYGGWNERRMNSSILSSNDTTADSFFKPYLNTQEKNNIGDEQGQTKRKCSNTSNSDDDKPNKRVCKAEKFKAIKYSLGPNEEYIAIRRCEYDAWERNKDSMSKIYQEFFQKKDNGWKVTRTE
ncbi:hypothetical protein Tco_1218723 [Tanacetum coccineum]